MGMWAIVEGTSRGRLCVVPESMVSEHLTYGRETCVWLKCSGLLEAMEELHRYERRLAEEAMEELKPYRELGTVEEFAALKQAGKRGRNGNE